MGMNTIVVDGYNLIRRVGELKALDERELELGRAELERLLSRYVSSRKNLRAVVVYDSPSAPSGSYRSATLPGVSVRYSDRADETVVELARRFAAAGDQVLAVSSDRSGVALPLAGVNRVEVHKAEEFWSARLAAPGRGKISRRAGKGKPENGTSAREKPNRVSAGEVAFWLEAFGAAGEEEEE
jgi:predicted RNA-binding protein with PIN domain